MTLIMMAEETFTVLENVEQDVILEAQKQPDVAAFIWTEDEVDWEYGY